MTRILVVDDEETIRLALRKFLRSRGYEVEIASSGDHALQILEKESFALMLCDVRMPGMTGVQIVPQAIERDQDLAIIMLTAVNDAATATEVLSSGATDYLMKPVELADLQQAVDRALHKRSELMEQRRLDKLIREEVALRTAELEREKESLRLMSISIAETLINAMEAKDLYLRGHSQRVAELAGQIAETMVRSGLQAIWNFAPGKLNVPAHIIVHNEDLYNSLASLSWKLARRFRVPIQDREAV